MSAKRPTHLPPENAYVSPTRATIELPDSNVTSRRPFGFARALPPSSPMPLVEAWGRQLEVEEK